VTSRDSAIRVLVAASSRRRPTKLVTDSGRFPKWRGRIRECGSAASVADGTSEGKTGKTSEGTPGSVSVGADGGTAGPALVPMRPAV
jgi:hypothetical protein